MTPEKGSVLCCMYFFLFDYISSTTMATYRAAEKVAGCKKVVMEPVDNNEKSVKIGSEQSILNGALQLRCSKQQNRANILLTSLNMITGIFTRSQSTMSKLMQTRFKLNLFSIQHIYPWNWHWEYLQKEVPVSLVILARSTLPS